jgi:hypothetical protein
MRFGKILAIVSAAALTCVPIAAQAAQTAGSSTVSKVKRVSPAKKSESKMGGDSTLLLILAVILIGAGIFVLADNEDDSPTSP